jgi:putative membrane protein
MANAEQQAHSKQPAESEPDYRFTLANERTFLAWIRTALALLAGAVAVVQFAPEFSIPGGGQLLAALLAILSIACVAGAALRWRTSQKAMRRDAPLPSTKMPWLLAGGIIIIGLIVFALTLIFTPN